LIVVVTDEGHHVLGAIESILPVGIEASNVLDVALQLGGQAQAAIGEVDLVNAASDARLRGQVWQKISRRIALPARQRLSERCLEIHDAKGASCARVRERRRGRDRLFPLDAEGFDVGSELSVQCPSIQSESREIIVTPRLTALAIVLEPALHAPRGL